MCIRDSSKLLLHNFHTHNYHPHTGTVTLLHPKTLWPPHTTTLTNCNPTHHNPQAHCNPHTATFAHHSPRTLQVSWYLESICGQVMPADWARSPFSILSFSFPFFSPSFALRFSFFSFSFCSSSIYISNLYFRIFKVCSKNYGYAAKCSCSHIRFKSTVFWQKLS